MPSKIDLSSALAGLESMRSPKFRESLARSMAVAGGKMFRDEAKRWVPVDSGRLKSAIYVVYQPEESRGGVFQYKVSWNASKAPHGYLIEFGHWQNYRIVKLANGDWFTDVTQPLAKPKWVAAKPFLRPAWDIGKGKAASVMVQRGRQRVPELLRDMYNDAEFV